MKNEPNLAEHELVLGEQLDTLLGRNLGECFNDGLLVRANAFFVPQVWSQQNKKKKKKKKKTFFLLP